MGYGEEVRWKAKTVPFKRDTKLHTAAHKIIVTGYRRIWSSLSVSEVKFQSKTREHAGIRI